LATGSTAALAASPSGEPAFYLTTKRTGILTRIDHDHGLGFIAVEGGGADVFVHYSAMAPGVFETLQVGQQLKFDIEADPQGRGQRAVNVVVADR
jgi:CspA family cold shock protein